MTYTNYFYTLLLFFLCISCNKKTTPPANKEAPESAEETEVKETKTAELKGGWKVVSFPYEGKTFSPTVNYSVNFEGESMGISLEINNCGVSCRFSDNTLIIKDMMSCTEACCDSKEGQSLVNLFRGELKYKVEDNVLTITSPQGPIKLSKKRESGLQGSQWVALNALNYTDRKEGQRISFSKKYVLRFEEAMVQLRLDVNTCKTSCKYSESTIELAPMACSRKCCDSEDGQLLMQSLQGKITYKKEDENLVLKTNDKLIIFAPAKTSNDE